MTDNSYGIIPVRVIEETIFFLVIQHRQGHWGFPKGHAEPGETPTQSACREFTEETGITEFRICDCDAFTEQYQFEKNGQTVKKTVIYYLARILTDNVTIQEEEIQNFKLADYNTAYNLITFEEGKNLLKNVYDHIIDRGL